MQMKLLRNDPYLRPYENDIRKRNDKISRMISKLTNGDNRLGDFASGHEYFGLHRKKNKWLFREWAPNASRIFMVGDFSNWNENSEFALKPIGNEGVWQIELPGNLLAHESLFRLSIHWPGGRGDRLPAYARRVVQDRNTLVFNAQVWSPDNNYQWKCDHFTCDANFPLIYEVHVGMAQEEEKIGSYREFTKKILPMIAESGYNTLQLMAVQEHPYYGSFGYHVTNFFAASSRFGSPEDLKELIDRAHELGMAVIMDLVHSHCAKNEVEGISALDGTLFQYFHDHPRGMHSLWDSRCFDYGKYQVLHFLLSNCRFWLDEYRIDGFRFDGITSMLYLDHGMNKAFTNYDDYFGANVDEDAITYLGIANRLIHEIRPDAVTIAEDMSGMPGLAAPVDHGGIGFDFRLAMGVPDHWIKLVKDSKDEDWHMGRLWFELTNRRKDEKTISYSESHDQALVGDKTLMFRLVDSNIYDHMTISDDNICIDRGMALHKMIRLITLTTAGNGYQNFMGNEFGHPEWIDFPREGNGWSFFYARRQWHLVNDPGLKYKFLAKFDRDMLGLVNNFSLLSHGNVRLVHEHNENKVIAFKRGDLAFVFNFHPTVSHADYTIFLPSSSYEMIFDTDQSEYGGHGRLKPNHKHFSQIKNNDKTNGSDWYPIMLYLPSRTALVLRKIC